MTQALGMEGISRRGDLRPRGPALAQSVQASSEPAPLPEGGSVSGCLRLPTSWPGRVLRMENILRHSQASGDPSWLPPKLKKVLLNSLSKDQSWGSRVQLFKSGMQKLGYCMGGTMPSFFPRQTGFGWAPTGADLCGKRPGQAWKGPA